MRLGIVAMVVVVMCVAMVCIRVLVVNARPWNTIQYTDGTNRKR